MKRALVDSLARILLASMLIAGGQAIGAVQPALADQFIVNLLSKKCLDVAGAPGKANGTRIQLWTCERGDSATDQLWEFTNDGHIRNTLSGRCVDVAGAHGTKTGTGIQLWDCEDPKRVPGTDQLWDFEGGFIVNRLSGKCLDVSGAPGTRNGAPILLWDCEESGFNANGSATDHLWR